MHTMLIQETVTTRWSLFIHSFIHSFIIYYQTGATRFKSFKVNLSTVHVLSISRKHISFLTVHVSIVECVPSWTTHGSTNVNDGQSVSNATNVLDCRAACVDHPQCTGVDYIPTNPAAERCWLSGPWSGQRNNGTEMFITHYDLRLNRDCWGWNVDICLIVWYNVWSHDDTSMILYTC